MLHEDLFNLGTAIRDRRKQAGRTLKYIAGLTGLSSGLLSKIENSRTIPSLPVLMKIAKALQVSLSEILRDVEGQLANPYILVRKTERKKAKRENKRGYHYETILTNTLNEGFIETAVIHLNDQATGSLITTDGDMFLYCLDGTMHLQLAEEHIRLDHGDAIFFDGRTPHISQHLGPGSASVLVIYLLHHGPKQHG